MEIKTYEIQTKKIKKEEKALRLVMLSDLHDRLWGEKQKILLDAIDRLNGDLILCAGDMLIGKEQSRMENAILLFGNWGKEMSLFTAATAIMSPECASSSQFMGGSINSMPDSFAVMA